jgi:hypothetical protein
MDEKAEDHLLAVIAVVAHATGEKSIEGEMLQTALSLIRDSGAYDQLGRALSRRLHVIELARLRARRAILVAKLSSMPKPPLH